MKLFHCLIASLVVSCTAFADRPILLVTPKGVWQAEVVDGVPGQFVAKPYDVIVQGFGNNPLPPGEPVPPPNDQIVEQVKALSLAPKLKDAAEGTAVAALVDALSKLGLVGNKFKEALEMAAPIADTSLQAQGRITAWSKAVLLVTSDAAKIKAGVSNAWNIPQTSLDTIYAASQREVGAAVPAEALDWVKIIEMIQLILNLLKNLGFI